MTKLTFVVALFAFTLAACKKNDQKTPPPPPPSPPAPVLSSAGGKDTTTVGDSLRLSDRLKAPDTATYNWKIGGQSVGTDSVFTYHPTNRGDFQITVVVSNPGGSDSATFYIHVYGLYEQGFFMITEQQTFGGPILFYRYGDNQTELYDVYTTANPGKDLGPSTVIPEYGAIWDGRFYLLCKTGGPILQLDPYSLKETARLAASSTADWRAFLGIDSTHALVSSATGIYTLNLSTMTITGQVSPVTGQVGDMTSAGNYIFVISQSAGLVALNKSDYSIARTISPIMNMGFAKTLDAGVWAGGDSTLVRVDPATLDTITLTTGFFIQAIWPDWHPGCITASPVANTFWFSGASVTYGQQYEYGALQAPWPFNYGAVMYGDGLGCDSAGNLYTVVLGGAYDDFPQLWLPSGAKASINLSDHPSMMVFH